jgi:hypothetical protein
VSVAV